MQLPEIQEKLQVKFAELWRYATLEGYELTEGTIKNFIRGKYPNPTEDTAKGVEVAFMTAAKKRESTLTAEITAWFEAYRGDGDA